MSTKFLSGNGWARLVALSGLLLLALALVPTARADEGDPPTRVARISYLKGSVSMQPGGAGEWTAAALNRSMTVGDRLWTDADARAELQAGNVTMHLNGNTALSFLNLDERTTQMRVPEGVVNFRVREMREGELIEVDTPNLAFTVKSAGDFRVNVNEAGDVTSIITFRGEGEVTAGGQTYVVRPGERAEFRGTENLQYETSPAPDPDNFDRWAMERDARGEHSRSAQYVSRDVIGYEDLDDNGYWRVEPDYGPVWYPYAVAPGWAPYSYGYWGWTGPWGWTWIDYAPWGFAPFHYGRWGFIGGGWGWCPGPLFVSPVWGPAFVGFIGGPGFGFGFGGFWGGNVGWFPLGFGEPFFPWFRSSRTFITNINVRNTFIRNTNIINTTNIHNFNFVNAHNVNAVTAMSQRGFVSGQAVNRGAMHLTAENLRNAQVLTHNSLTPTRQSILGANAGARVSTPPRAIENRPVFTRTAPAAGARNLPAHSISASAQVAARASSPAVNNERAPMSRPQPGLQESARAKNPAASSDRAPVNARGGQAGAAAITPRQRELQLDKPNPGARGGGGTQSPAINNERAAGANSPRGNAGQGRAWDAQGNTTDRGRPPQGFGRPSTPSGPTGGAVRSQSTTQADRPPWARGSSGAAPTDRGATPRAGAQSNSNAGGSRGASAPQNDRSWRAPQSNNSGRSYQPPSYSQGGSSPRNANPAPRSYDSPRTYSAPRSYSAPPSYSAPRSYSAPSTPSRSYGGGTYGGGGGGSYHGGGGGGYSGGGGGSYHGGGGGGGSPHSSGGGGSGSSHSGGGGGSSSHGRH